jgi:hypothetical protein
MIRIFGISVLIIGLGALLLVGLLRVIQELIPRSVFTAPSPSKDASRQASGTRSELR